MLIPAMTLTDLDTAVASKKPVFAIFTARWCGNCHSFKPSVRKWMGAHPEVTALEVDVERFEAVADAQRVQSMPTFMAWKKGERVARHSGVMSEDGFGKWAEKWLA
jgi:thiol-disulfide isomerase/thioredoxin